MDQHENSHLYPDGHSLVAWLHGVAREAQKGLDDHVCSKKIKTITGAEGENGNLGTINSFF